MLGRKLKALFPSIDFTKDCLLQDDSDGSGPYIKKWNRVEPEPTQAELDAVSVPDDATIKAKIEADALQKEHDFTDNIPNWQTVTNNIDAITNLAEAKAFLRKLARVVYWLAKNTSE